MCGVCGGVGVGCVCKEELASKSATTKLLIVV